MDPFSELDEDQRTAIAAEQAAVNERIREMGQALPPAGQVPLDLLRTRETGPSGEPLLVHPEAKDLIVPGPGGAPDVRVRVHPNAEAKALLIHVHGGGFVFGSPDHFDRELSALAAETGTEVLVPQWRLAPEHPHPAGRDDVAEVIGWAFDQTEQRDLRGVILAGESAGAQVALDAVLAQHRGDRRLLGLALLFGFFDLSLSASARAWGDDHLVVNTPWLEWFLDQLLPGVGQAERTALSAINQDLTDLPHLQLMAGSADPLIDDTLDLARALTSAGVDHELWLYPDAPHGFISHPTTIGRHATAKLNDFIRSLP